MTLNVPGYIQSVVFRIARKVPRMIGLLIVACTIHSPAVSAFTLPANFENLEAVGGLEDPDGLAFSPDGRMFISERITGKLRIAIYDAGTDSWTLLATPFHRFPTPTDGNGIPAARRSAGLRDITFDPAFSVNGYVYAFYMHNNDLHNRVVRIRGATPAANISNGAEQVLLKLPFNDNASSGSHNGGAIEFGGDGYLYITTGDGWEGEFAGDPVQSLATMTGKVLRLNADGSIPADNPFFNQTTGTYRAIYALGLRNPYSMSRNPDTGELYVNEARGTNKAQIYRLEAGANYQHEGSGIGVSRTPWANASGAGGELITGGAWMPATGRGSFPDQYDGVYFTALWGGNASATGQISYVRSTSDITVTAFETNVGTVGANGIPVKPVVTRIGPRGDLYYLLTTYTTRSGAVRRVRYTPRQTVATPVFSPAGGVSPTPVDVLLSTATPGSAIHYTTDNSTPNTNSPLYVDPVPVTISSDTILKARAFRSGFNPSATASDAYLIGERPDNQAPLVDAGSDETVYVGQTVTLDGSGTTDPDGDDDFLTGEQWTQLAGPNVAIQDAAEEIAHFVPTVAGSYRFRLRVSDGFDTGSDEVEITVIHPERVTTGLQVLYAFDEGSGATVRDVSGVAPAMDLTIQNPAGVSWISGDGLRVNASTRISGEDNKISAACSASNAITIEAWVTPRNTTQSGPKRIVSLSTNLTNRNFTLGQQADRFDVRLRTTTTDDNGVPSLATPAATVRESPTQVVYSRDPGGSATIYVDGIPRIVGSVAGNLSNWDADYSLTLINEMTDDRGWLGDIHLAAVYCTALDSGEVQQNYAAGIGSDSAHADSDGDGIADCIDPQPDLANNLCSGSDPVLGDMVATTDILCAANGSVTLGGEIDTRAGGRLQLMSPVVRLRPGVSVQTGGVLHMQSINPAECP